MRITTEEFISSFHSLTGATVGERRKNLFLLLNAARQAECTELNFSLLQPKTPLEEKFKVDVLIFFRRVPELIEVLKNENPILITRVLKASSWFVEEAFRNSTGEELVTVIFPCISFSAKVKIINRLTSSLQNLQQAHVFFEAIKEKYGIHLAAKLLAACSSDLILSFLKSYRIILPPRQVLLIIKKYPHITEALLEALRGNNADLRNEYKNVFRYIAQHDITLFLKLHSKYSLAYRLGWRITHRVVQVNRQNIIKNPNVYYNLLHNRQIAKSLSQDFITLYHNLFPATLAQFEDSFEYIWSILRQLPPKMRNVDLLLSTFEKVYGSELWAHPKYVTPQVIEMLPPVERQRQLKTEYRPSYISEDRWNCYWETEKSIPLLKSRISLSSDIRMRAKLVELLVETCKLNEDKAALASVCRYAVARHRNDHSIVRLAFLRAVKCSFKLDHLEEQHWTPINELIQIFSVNGESFRYNADFLEPYIHFRLLNCLPVEEQLEEWLKLCPWRLNIVCGKPEYEKQCLLTFTKMVPELFKDDDLQSLNITLLSALIDWNKRHKKDQMDVFTFANIMESFKKVLKENNYSCNNFKCIIQQCLDMRTSAEIKKAVMELYLSRTNLYFDGKILKYLIQSEPLRVAVYIDTVTQNILKSSASTDIQFWRHCQNYTHIDIPQKVVNICVNSLKDDATDLILIQNAIIGLSLLMPGSKFLSFIGPYYPSKLQANAKTDEDKKIYKFQQSIGSSLKYLNPSSLALESILIFCKGDYLKLIQRSLYSVSGSTSENKLAPFISELMRHAVSIRKHALHLTFRVLDKQQVISILNTFMEAEKNASVRKFIFRTIFNFFVAHPNEYSWNLFKLNINAVDINDEEALQILMQTDKIPRSYIAQYILFAWDVLEKAPDRDCNREHDKSRLLVKISSDLIQLLPQEFCDMVITKYLLKSELTGFQSDVQSFACRYIIYCNTPAEQEERLNSLFAILKDYIISTWHNPALRQESRNCSTYIVGVFCNEFLKDEGPDRDILLKFTNLWNGFLKPHEAFDQYLYLEFTLLYTEKLSVPQIGQRLAGLCDAIVRTYSEAVIDIFYKRFTHFAKHLIPKDAEKNWCALINSLTGPDSSVANLLLAILLLNNVKTTMSETKEFYNNIIDMLGKHSNPIIQLYLHNHFNGIPA